MNRYERAKISLAPGVPAQARISGVFTPGDEEEFVAAAELSFDLVRAAASPMAAWNCGRAPAADDRIISHVRYQRTAPGVSPPARPSVISASSRIAPGVPGGFMGRFSKRLLLSTALTVLALAPRRPALGRAGRPPSSEPRISLPSGALENSLLAWRVQRHASKSCSKANWSPAARRRRSMAR
jgi:hypothetical protein